MTTQEAYNHLQASYKAHTELGYGLHANALCIALNCITMAQEVMSIMDTILCNDKEDAKKCIDELEDGSIIDWVFLPEGKVRLYVKKGIINNDTNRE